MRFFNPATAIVSAAVIVGVSAGVTNVSKAQVADANLILNKRSGCGSSGPLGTGHFKWFMVVNCTPGASLTCQATDASGCVPGDAGKIGSMEVDDPNDTVQFASQSNTNTLGFQCPAGGQVRCQANFNDNDDGPGYSLRGKSCTVYPASVLWMLIPTIVF